MEMLTDLIKVYATGCLVYLSYLALEISSLQQQNEHTRDKNLKNTLVAQAKQSIGNAKMAWAWPYVVGKTIVQAVKWSMSL